MNLKKYIPLYKKTLNVQHIPNFLQLRVATSKINLIQKNCKLPQHTKKYSQLKVYCHKKILNIQQMKESKWVDNSMSFSVLYRTNVLNLKRISM